MEELRAFNEYNDLYKKYKEYGVDRTVYKNGGMMRAILSNKPCNDRTKLPLNFKRNLYKHLITSNEYTNKEFKNSTKKPFKIKELIGKFLRSLFRQLHSYCLHKLMSGYLLCYHHPLSAQSIQLAVVLLLMLP